MSTPLATRQSAQKGEASSSRVAMLVLGMHRSGTSALTGALIRLGAQAPATLMIPLDANPLGYWESRPFCDFHDRMLDAGGSAWDQWTAFNPDEAIGIDLATEFAEDFARLLDDEFGDARLFIMKDPRICRFVPFWLRQLSAAAITPAALIPLRSPLAVAQSLAARDGMGIPNALLVWLRHVLDAEIGTRGAPRCIVRYQDLLTDWRPVIDKITATLHIEWPTPPELAAAGVTDFLHRELCHHAERFDELPVGPPLADWVPRTARALDRLVDDDSAATTGVYAELDAIRSEFDRVTAIFGPVLAEQRARVTTQVSRRHNEKLAALDEKHRAAAHTLEQQVQARTTEVDVACAANERLQGELAVKTLEADAAHQTSGRLQGELAAKIIEAEGLRTALVSEVERLAATVAETEQLRASLSAANDDRAHLREELITAQATADRRQAELRAATEIADHLRVELRAGAELSEDLRAQLHRVTAAFESAAEENRRHSEELAALQQVVSELRTHSTELHAQLDHVTSERDLWRSRMTDVLASASWRVTGPLRRVKDLLTWTGMGR